MAASANQRASVGGGCCGFSGQHDGHLETQNAQVAKLIVALGENDEGKMAILKAIAERQGITGKRLCGSLPVVELIPRNDSRCRRIFELLCAKLGCMRR